MVLLVAVAKVFGVPAPEAEAAAGVPLELEGPAPACNEEENAEEVAELDILSLDRLKLGREQRRVNLCADESKMGASFLMSVLVPTTKRRVVFEGLAVAVSDVCLCWC